MRNFIAFVGAACLLPTILTQSFADEPGLRASLIKTQSEIRKVTARKEGQQPAEDCYSSALETAGSSLLAAHMEFELGVLLLLQGKGSEARIHWEASRKLLESGEGKAWLRRVNAATLLQDLLALPPTADPSLVARIVGNGTAVVDQNPLPSSGTIPFQQLTLEHWLFSSDKMFRLCQWLQSGPNESEARLAATKRVFEEICRHRLLNERLTSGQRSMDHESIVDEAIFKRDMPAAFANLLDSAKLAGKQLSSRAVWEALLAAWASESSVPATGAWDDTLPESCQGERFQTLAALAEILNRFGFTDASKKLALQVASLSPSNCPPGETAMGLAELLINGGQFQAADGFMLAAGNETPQVALLRVKWLFAQRRYADAVAKAGALTAASHDTPESRFWLGKSLLALDKQADARKAFRDFLEIAPESHSAPEACLLSGMLSSNLHEPKLASTYYEETISRYPNSPEAARALELLE